MESLTHSSPLDPGGRPHGTPRSPVRSRGPENDTFENQLLEREERARPRERERVRSRERERDVRERDRARAPEERERRPEAEASTESAVAPERELGNESRPVGELDVLGTPQLPTEGSATTAPDVAASEDRPAAGAPTTPVAATPGPTAIDPQATTRPSEASALPGALAPTSTQRGTQPQAESAANARADASAAVLSTGPVPDAESFPSASARTADELSPGSSADPTQTARAENAERAAAAQDELARARQGDPQRDAAARLAQARSEASGADTLAPTRPVPELAGPLAQGESPREFTAPSSRSDAASAAPAPAIDPSAEAVEELGAWTEVDAEVEPVEERASSARVESQSGASRPEARPAGPTAVDSAAPRESAPRAQATTAATEAPPAGASERPESPEQTRAGTILRQLRVAIGPQTQRATIQLQPLELGRISIRMSIEGGRMAAVVRAESEETLRSLDKHLPELRAALSRQGIETERIDLGLGFQEGSSQSAQQQGGRRSNGSRTFELNAPEAGGSPAASETHSTRPVLNVSGNPAGGVDTYA